MGSICNTGKGVGQVVVTRTNSLPITCSEMITPTKFIQQHFSSFFDTYIIENKTIGEGLYGVVKKCVHKRSGLLYAVKEIAKSGLPRECIRNKTVQKQIGILKEIDHPCVLRTHELYEDKNYFYIVMDYYSGGDLIEKVLNEGKIPESECVVITWQILAAVSYLHKKNIVHRDLKPENIVLEDKDSNISVKIIDFDTAVHCIEPLTEVAGTLDYMAPEVLKKRYDEKVDMWSLGVLLYVLLSGNSPFGGSTEEVIKLNISKGKFDLEGPVWKEISGPAKDLIRKMLVVDPEQRISAPAALQHPWINNSPMDQGELVNTLMRVKDFSNTNKFQEVIYSYILSHIIPHEKLKALKLVFQHLDYNADGKLSKSEILYALEGSMELDTAAEAVEIIFNNGDSDKNGYLEYTEFLRAAIDKENLLSEENLIKTFQAIDITGDGVVTYSEFEASFGVEICSSVLEELLQMVDPDKTGKIGFEQFREFLIKI